MRKQHRKPVAALWPLLAGGLFATVMGESFISEKSMAAMAATLADPASLLDRRSPGERDPGAKFSTKQKHAAAPAGKPHERVLAAVRDPALLPPIGLPDMGAPVLPPLPVFAALPAGPLGAGFPIGGGVGPAGFGAPGIGAPIPWGGGGGGGSGGTPTPTPTPTSTPTPTPTPTSTPTPPVSAVPEPASWAMLLMGFATAGAILRRTGRETARRRTLRATCD